MKIRIALMGMFLFLAISQLPGQERAKTAIIDEPAFEKSMEGLDLKVWIVDEKNKSRFVIRNEEEESGMAAERNQVVTDGPINDSALPIGTHYIAVSAKETDGKEMEESPTVLIESPSKGATKVRLKALRDNYVGSLILEDKGEYKFTLTVNVSGIPEAIPFTYTVK